MQTNNQNEIAETRKKMKQRINAFAYSMRALLNGAQGKDISLETLLRGLGKKGQATLLILLSLPFCQPIQIPGFSTPFGILLAFIGTRIAFGNRIWLPKYILDKKISYQHLEKIVSISIKITDKLRYFVYARFTHLVKNPLLQIMHGLTITLLGLVLALPLPIPLSNILAAFPLTLFGLAILEDDGAAILVAYGLSLLCFFVLALLIWLGKEGLISLFQ